MMCQCGVKMNYATIKKFDIANGPGVGLSLFVSGCTHHCKGCFNEEAWDFNFGERYTKETTQNIVEFYQNNPQVKTFSLLGGEPFDQGCDSLYIIDLVRRLRQETNCENFWVWSGYTFDKILQSREKVKMLLYFDVLVDGKFELDKKDPRLMYRGSSNQRVIDIQKSIDSGEVILWSENDDL